MNILNNLKLDKWYGIVLYLGTMTVTASLFTTVGFVEAKHLFGIGLGGILVGLSFGIAERNISTMLLVGICLLLLFGYFIVKQLI